MNGESLSAWLKWLGLKTKKRLIHTACKKLYRDSDRDLRKSMMLIGAARSGTTWVAEMIASRIPCRLMSEPFNPHRVAAFRRFNDFPYRRPEAVDPALLAYATKILSGNIRDSWIDREVNHIFPRYRLIKEIRAHLFLRWLQNAFPQIPMVFLVRHPCAVVLSRLEANWESEPDIAAFLSQPEVRDDFLLDKLEFIKSITAPEERHALIWCIQHLVPIQQFRDRPLAVFFYENLCRNPEREVAALLRALGQEDPEISSGYVDRPSRTSSPKSAVLTGENKINRWEKKFSDRQIKAVLKVVKVFGLDYIYGDSAVPRVASLWKQDNAPRNGQDETQISG